MCAAAICFARRPERCSPIKQEAQRYRRDRLVEIDEQIRQIQSGPQTVARQDMLRQWQNTRRDVQEALQRGGDASIESVIPAWLSLALGSAYFRSGQMSDAEREYKAAIAADTRAGEAHNNLAVVYLETGRIAEADADAAEREESRLQDQPTTGTSDQRAPEELIVVNHTVRPENYGRLRRKCNSSHAQFNTLDCGNQRSESPPPFVPHIPEFVPPQRTRASSNRHHSSRDRWHGPSYTYSVDVV